MQYTPARTLPFAEVRDRVRERVVASPRAELARKDGMEKLAAWKAQPGSANLACGHRGVPTGGAEAAVGRGGSGAARRPLGAARLDRCRSGGPGLRRGQGQQGVPARTPPPEVAKQERQQYAQAWAIAENLAYYNLLKDRFKVQMKVAKPSGLDEPVPSQ